MDLELSTDRKADFQNLSSEFPASRAGRQPSGIGSHSPVL